MCGRFVSTTSAEELADYFAAEAPPDDEEFGGRPPSYNVAPSQDILAVYHDGTSRRIDAFRWGLVPFWAKDPKIGNRMINARSETIAEKNSFKRPFAKRRCIIPADGFYEWKKIEGSKFKQPTYMSRVDGAPFAFAGLWEIWNDPGRLDDSGEPMRLHSCTILTGEPNDKVAEVHDRMPVMLPPSAWDTWLDSDNHDTETLSQLFTPAPSQLIRIQTVSTEVNNVRNNRPDLIEPID